MVNSCAAIGCTNRTKAGSGISFHRFPLSRQELLHKWVRAVRREKCTPNRYSFICSVHFHASCFIVKPGVVGRRLHPDAVPSIFPTLKQYYQSSYKIRRSPVKWKYLSPTKVVKSIATEHSYENHEKVEVGDIVSETDNEIEKLQQRVIKLKEKVKLLNQKLRRQQKKIETLEDLLGNLKEEECISNEQLNLMHHNFEGVAKQLFSDQARNATFDNKTSNRYSQETKQFAMTLHYYREAQWWRSSDGCWPIGEDTHGGCWSPSSLELVMATLGRLADRTPDARHPSWSPLQVWIHMHTHMHTYTNIWGGRSWPSRGPPRYDRKPSNFRIISHIIFIGVVISSKLAFCQLTAPQISRKK